MLILELHCVSGFASASEQRVCLRQHQPLLIPPSCPLKCPKGCQSGSGLSTTPRAVKLFGDVVALGELCLSHCAGLGTQEARSSH